MKTKTIEQYDKTRHSSLIIATIGWSIFFGCMILREQIAEGTIYQYAVYAGIVGFLLFLSSIYRLSGIKRAMKENPDIKSALENEVFIANKHKSLIAGFWVLLASNAMSIFLLGAFTVDARLLLEISCFAAVLTTLVSKIVLNSN